MRLLKRKEVIEYWERSSEYMEYYTCPCCRNILHKISEDEYECKNLMCKIKVVYKEEE